MKIMSLLFLSLLFFSPVINAEEGDFHDLDPVVSPVQAENGETQAKTGDDCNQCTSHNNMYSIEYAGPHSNNVEADSIYVGDDPNEKSGAQKQ